MAGRGHVVTRESTPGRFCGLGHKIAWGQVYAVVRPSDLRGSIFGPDIPACPSAPLPTQLVAQSLLIVCVPGEYTNI